MAGKVVKCSRCGKRMRRDEGWTVNVEGGRITEYLCPDDSTFEEQATAQEHDEDGDLSVDEFGRLHSAPKRSQ